MVEFLARYLNSMKRIYVVMVSFGLMMGLVFPFFASPFVVWDPDRKPFFIVACLAAGFAVGTFCYFLIKVTLYQRNLLLARRKAELEDAKERFSSLTRAAIMRQDWQVSMYDGKVPTCWEVKKCQNDKCPVYGQENQRCWLIAGTLCRNGEAHGRFAQKIGDCAGCEVYQAAAQGNPMNEISENFNSLMLAFREKEEMLAAANAELKVQYGELELLHKQAREMADSDLLTGLRNHAHFQQHLKWEVAKAGQAHRKLSLVMLDLDHFKSVNDSFGHQKGDEVLRSLGQLLAEEASSGGYAARYGGEEFMLLLPQTSAQKALEVADRIRRNMNRVAREAELPERYVGASLGVADYPSCAADADSLLSAADSALLFAKRRGRDRVAYFRDLSDTELKDGDIERLQSRLEGASLQTIRALAEAVDASDQYSDVNMDQLVEVTSAMARQLGIEDERADALVLATRLHDVGKVGIPGSVLRKKDKLTGHEMALVQRHPEIGQRLLEEARQLQDLISAILYHHERWDGKGYPEKLEGEQIPLAARIVGIVDAYRAMRSERPYRRALSFKQATRELRKGSGSQFDPRLVELFIDQLEAGSDTWEQKAAG